MSSLMVNVLLASNAYSHGVISSTARITERHNGMVEIKVQFDLVSFLNHKQTKYSLSQLSALSLEEFAVIYRDLIKHFNQTLSLKLGQHDVFFNKYYPSSEQVYELVKREFIESQMSEAARNSVPYTFDDRRFYQTMRFSFKLNKEDNISALKILFPPKLGNMYVTYSKAFSRELHAKETWQL